MATENQTGKGIGVAFLVIIAGLFAGIVMPQLFSGILSQSGNAQLYQSIRIILVIMVILLIGFAAKFFIGGIDV